MMTSPEKSKKGGLSKEKRPENSFSSWLEIIDFLKNEKLPVDDEMIRKLEECDWNPEIQHNEKLSVIIGTVFLGKKIIGADNIYAATRAIVREAGYENDPTDITPTSGFEELSKMPNLTPSQRMLMQQEVAKALILPALEKIKIKPTEIDLVIITTSFPISPEQHLNIAQALGIPQEVLIIRFWEACNSSGRGRAWVSAGKFDQEIIANQERRGVSTIKDGNSANILLFAIDDGGSLVKVGSESNQNYADKDHGGAFQLFSDAASFMIWKHGGDEATFGKQLSLVDWSKAEGMENLQFKQILEEWPDFDPKKEKYLFVVQHATSPEGNRIIDMNPRIGGVFRKLVVTLIKETLEKTVAENPKVFQNTQDLIDQIKKVFMHHPNKLIFDHVGKKLAKDGLEFTPEQVRWVITEGNAPVTTIIIALGRQLESLKPGDLTMFVTFGAGGEMTCAIERLGPGQKKN